MTRIVTRELARWAAACAVAAAVAYPQDTRAQQIRPEIQTQPQARDQAQSPEAGQPRGEEPSQPASGDGQQSDGSASSPEHTAAKPFSGGGWSAEIDRVPPDGAPADLTSEEAEFVRRINDYLNGLKHLEGRFVQISHNNKRTHGKFYVQRPGRLRFDYAPPSKLRIVADGDYLSIEDHDLNTVDQYPLESTPFQLLLGKDVNLFRDARILDVRRAEETAMIALEDKTGEAAGQLELYFKLPDLQLDEWVVTDPQGLDTRIQLADLVRGKEISKEFFRSTPLEFRTLGTQ